MRLAIFSAFPQEVKHIVRNTRAIRSSESSFPLSLGKYSGKEIIVVLTGMGGVNTEAALGYVLKEYTPDAVVSLGFGGALYDEAEIGEIVWGSRLFLVRDGIEESLDLPHSADVLRRVTANSAIREGEIFTLERLKRKSQIRKILPPGSQFPVSDMETFFLAKLAQKKGLPFSALRSITDRADEEIPPEFLTVSDESGQYRLSRALRLLCKPKLLKDIARIGRNSYIASNNLWHAVRCVIEVL